MNIVQVLVRHHARHTAHTHTHTHIRRRIKWEMWCLAVCFFLLKTMHEFYGIVSEPMLSTSSSSAVERWIFVCIIWIYCYFFLVYWKQRDKKKMNEEKRSSVKMVLGCLMLKHRARESQSMHLPLFNWMFIPSNAFHTLHCYPFLCAVKPIRCQERAFYARVPIRLVKIR